MTRLREADLLVRSGTPAIPPAGFVRLYVDTSGALFVRTENGAIIGPIGSVSGVLLADGSVALAGNLAVNPGVTIDGRDISVDGAALDALPAFVIDEAAAATHVAHASEPAATHAIVDADHMVVYDATNGAASLVVDVGNGGLPAAPGTRVTFVQAALGFPVQLVTSGGMTLRLPPNLLPRTVNALYSKVTITILDALSAMVEGDLAGIVQRVTTTEDLTSNTDDWTPADPTADVIFVTNSNGGAISVTGLNMGASQVDGREVLIINMNAAGPDETIGFQEDNVGSVVTNRFLTPGGNGIPLVNQGAVLLRYTTALGSGTPGRWMAATIEITF